MPGHKKHSLNKSKSKIICSPGYDVDNFSPFYSDSYIEPSIHRVNCSCHDKSFLAIPNMPEFHQTKVVCLWPHQNYHYLISTCFTAYSDKYKICLQTTNFSVFIAFFSILSTDTTGVTTTTTMAAAGGNGPLAPHMRLAWGVVAHQFDVSARGARPHVGH
jgi:hypothetical protein